MKMNIPQDLPEWLLKCNEVTSYLKTNSSFSLRDLEKKLESVLAEYDYIKEDLDNLLNLQSEIVKLYKLDANNTKLSNAELSYLKQLDSRVGFPKSQNSFYKVDNKQIQFDNLLKLVIKVEDYRLVAEDLKNLKMSQELHERFIKGKK